jgi:F-type H+-transporting ATPase subunit delta
VFGLKERLQSILSESTGATVLLEEEINPDILGGFVFELDGNRMDASVEGQLAKIRRQLVHNNNRIV